MPAGQGSGYANGAPFLGQRYFDSYDYSPSFYEDTANNEETRALFWQALFNTHSQWGAADPGLAEGTAPMITATTMALDLPAVAGTDGTRLANQALHALALDKITRNRVWSPRYGVAPGYGLPLGCNNGFPEVFTASMTAALEYGDIEYAAGVFDNYFTNYLRRGGRLLAYRGLEMAQHGRILTVAAKLWWFSGRTDTAGALLLKHAGKLQAAAALLAHRRDMALSNPAITRSSPRYGMPTGNDEADLWHRTTGRVGGNRTELPYYSIAAEMYRGFTDLGEALGEVGLAYLRPDLVAVGRVLVANATALLADLERSLERTAAAARARTPGGCPISFVAGGSSCVVADPEQSSALQDRENEPWRTYSELMYAGVFPANLTQQYLVFAAMNNKTMKLGMLSGTGPSCCGYVTPVT